MERMEVFGGKTFVLRTHQLGPQQWSCDVFGRETQNVEQFVLQQFGESELEAFAMAASEVHHGH